MQSTRVDHKIEWWIIQLNGHLHKHELQQTSKINCLPSENQEMMINGRRIIWMQRPLTIIHHHGCNRQVKAFISVTVLILPDIPGVMGKTFVNGAIEMKPPKKKKEL